MAKKDLDVLVNAEPRTASSAAAARGREEAEVKKRISENVVRRRRRGAARGADAASPDEAAAASSKAAAPERARPKAESEKAPAAKTAPAAAAAQSAPSEPPAAPAAPKVAASSPAAPEEQAAMPSKPAAEAPVAAAPAEEKVVAPAAAATEAPAAADAAADAPQAPAKESGDDAKSDAAPTPRRVLDPSTPPKQEPGQRVAPAGEGAPSPRRYRGLGSAVVTPPPGYDPSNPEAFRARQEREAAARAPAATPGRHRRRVADTGRSLGAPAGPSGPSGPGGGRGRRGRRSRAVDDGMMAALRPRRRKSSGPAKPSPVPKAQKRKIRIEGVVTAGQLAHEMGLKASHIIKHLMEMDMLVSINEPLDADTAAIVASEFNYEIENVAFQEEEFLQHVGTEDDTGKQTPRPPVIAVMGHVDHGKTTLLDAIRKAKVAAGEAGGITQHIGAYQVEAKGQKITFLDTPGHAAFSAMRARGASVTDLVILVVAADDGVQPQTEEAISHARAAETPIIVAVNKMDKVGANGDAIRSRLAEKGLVPEDWGGDTMFVNVSALKRTGIDDLLDAVLLQAEVMELQANAERHAEGTVIEAKVERGKGAVATLLVQQGTLKRGDHVVLGTAHGKVRAMLDYNGKKIKQALPSTPVEIFGISDLPSVGDAFNVVANEKNARTLAEHRSDAEREALMSKTRRRTLEDLKASASEGDVKKLLLVLKGDVGGSVEALKAAIEGIEVDTTEVRILHAGVGNITESDINLVAANEGYVFGFNIKIDPRARKAADEAGVKPEIFSVIYDLLDRVKGLLKGMLEPTFEEQHMGSAEVRAIFNISRVGTIAGCYVQDGKVGRNHGARLYREGKEIWKGEVDTLKRFKDDVREVGTGYECGITLQGFNDLQVGDIIQTFAMVRIDPE